MNRLTKNTLIVMAGLTVLSGAASEARAQAGVHTYYPYRYYYPYYWLYPGYSAHYRRYDVNTTTSTWNDSPSLRGDYNEKTAKATLIKEQAREQYIKNIKLYNDLKREDARQQWRFDKDSLVNKQHMALYKALNDPKHADIHSGQVLNTLLADLQRVHAKGIRGKDVALDDELVKRINIQTGLKVHKILFLLEGRMEWPVLLRREEYKAQREELDALVPEALRQAAVSQVSVGSLAAINKALKQLRKRVDNLDFSTYPSNQLITANSFLSNYEESMNALELPEARSYLTGAYVAKGQSAAELVTYMTDKGMKFAPATGHNEAEYQALYWSLAAYCVSAHAEVGDLKHLVASK